MGVYLFPLQDIRWKRPEFHKPQINDYTVSGREAKIKRLKPSVYSEIIKMSLSGSQNDSLEFSDNKISKYSMQNGKCAITGEFLTADLVHCHHIKPRILGGSDSFKNLVIVHKWIHILIHATKKETIDNYLTAFQLNGKQLEKLNTYRVNCNLTEIH